MWSVRSRWRPVALAVTSLAVLAACGGDDGGTADTSPATTSPAITSAITSAATSAATAAATTAAPDDFPITVTGGNGEVVLDDRPEAIVSLSPTATEMLFAVGAGPQVIAVDALSNFPADAPVTDLSGYEPNVEAIAAYEPDLVVTDGTAAGLTDRLEALDIPVLELPAATTFDDVYAQIETVGAATGNTPAAAEVVDGMRAEVDAILADLPAQAEGLTYYHELDDTLYTVTSTTFIGQVYALLGLDNVADAADPDGASGGYPQLSAEYLLDADPDLIFLADTKCCGQSAATVAARPGWDVLTAVQQGHVVELDDDVASRWGPRVVELLRTVADAVDEVVAT